MSACESMVGLILTSVEGTLDAPARALLEAHAATCAGCRRALDEQTAVKRMLADLPPVQVSRGFAARVRERVDPRPWWMPAGNWRLWTLRLGPVAALVTILAWLPLPLQSIQPLDPQSDATSGIGATGGVTAETGGATGAGTEAASVSALESWAAAAVVAGASAAGENAVVPQLLDPSVHAHTLLAPSASAAPASPSGPSSASPAGGSPR